MALVAARGRLMRAAPAGAMAAVAADEGRVRRAMAGEEGVAIAAVNAPGEVVIGGPPGGVARVAAALSAAGVACRVLGVDRAFHTAGIEPALGGFERAAAGVRYAAPRPGLISAALGAAAGVEVATAGYWVEQARRPVRFEAAMRAAWAAGARAYVEVGPGSGLAGLGRRCAAAAGGGGAGVWVAGPRSGGDEWRSLLEGLGRLYAAGAAVDWGGLEGSGRRRVGLPTYPFQRRKYWPQRATPPDDPIRSSADSCPVPPQGLLGRRITSMALPEGEFLFEGRLSDRDQPYLSDHRVHNQVLVPAAVWLEMLLAAAARIQPSAAVVVEDLAIQKGLLLMPGRATRVQVLLRPSAVDGYRFRIASAGDEDDPTWTDHASGRLRLPAGGPHGASDLERLQVALAEILTAGRFYEDLAGLGIDFGVAFRSVNRLWRREGGGEALGEIGLRMGPNGDIGGQAWHTVAIDACLQVSAAAWPDRDAQGLRARGDRAV